MIRFCTILIFLLLVVTSIMLVVTKNKIANDTQTSAPAEGVAQIGGDFTLTNQDGKLVSDKDFRGKVMLVFFGFTSCPDICPVTAATYAKVLEMLGGKANEVAPIFITIDPQTDTPQVLKSYLGNIDSRIIGLTGTEEQTAHVASNYKAYFAKVKTEKGEDEMDHSGFVYIMDKNGTYVQHFPYDASAQDITAALLKLLK